MLPPEFFEQLLKAAEIGENNRVYTIAVVMWLMIAQRLQGNGSMQSAVLELLRGLPASFWPQPCKRLQDWQEDEGRKVSSHTGAYNKARQELPVSVVKQSCDRIFQQLIAPAGQGSLEGQQRVFYFDGTSVRLAHTEALYQMYPPGSNQHGASHWPLLRMLVAHALDTGLAMCPEWGPLNGPKAVSEPGLLEKAIDRMPSGAIVGGDGNFGVFSVAYAGDRRKHPVLLRLTPARAKHLAGEELREGIDRRIQWRPSREDRKRHPELPPRGVCAGASDRVPSPAQQRGRRIPALFVHDPGGRQRPDRKTVGEALECRNRSAHFERPAAHGRSHLQDAGYGGQGNLSRPCGLHAWCAQSPIWRRGKQTFPRAATASRRCAM